MYALACLLAAAPAVGQEHVHVVVLNARGYVDVGGGAWVPQQDFARQGSAAPGWSIQFGVGPKRWPFTFGVGAGAIATGSRSDAGPSGVWVHDGVVDFGP